MLSPLNVVELVSVYLITRPLLGVPSKGPSRGSSPTRTAMDGRGPPTRMSGMKTPDGLRKFKLDDV